jgi:hypothetical protein
LVSRGRDRGRKKKLSGRLAWELNHGRFARFYAELTERLGRAPGPLAEAPALPADLEPEWRAWELLAPGPASLADMARAAEWCGIRDLERLARLVRCLEGALEAHRNQQTRR